MNKKTILILLAVSAALAVFVAYPYWKNIFFDDSSDSGLSEPFSFSLSDITKDNTDAILLGTGEGQIRIEKNNNKWLLYSTSTEALAVKPEKIDRVFDSISDMVIIRLVSRNQANHSAFGVDKEGGTYAAFLKNGNPAAEFFIGKGGRQIGTFYLREKERSMVYLASGNLRSLVMGPFSEWVAESATSTVDNF